MVHYQIHSNVLTMNGQKMGKSYGNFITLEKLFTDTHPMLEQAYNPITIRFFALQTCYHSTVDFSSEALQAAERDLARLVGAVRGLDRIIPTTTSAVDAKALRAKCCEAMDDDLNSPIVIACLFEGAKMVNSILAGSDTITAEDLKELKETFHPFCFDILGLKEDNTSNVEREAAFGKAVDMLLEKRMKTKANEDQATGGKVRNKLTALGFGIKGGKNGCEWKLNK